MAMKFKFKIQQYQTDAVNAVVEVFSGQVKRTDNNFRLGSKADGALSSLSDIMGFSNTPVQLDDKQLLQNVSKIQDNYNLKRSTALVKAYNRISLDVEMETGTGKTYVYIKTIFELNKRYGWNKFIIVVPSIAIREGVKKSFEIMEAHFMESYGKKARYFIYDSSRLNQIDSFATDKSINVMIINTHAFNSSFNEDKNKEGSGGDKGARRIFTKRDEFGSRRPIDVIAKCNPILILDEPQKMGRSSVAKTQQAIAKFKPLFSLNYSATHAEQHNLVYALDALDAYQKRLVKKIEVKGFELHNLQGLDSYLYLHEIVLSTNKPPMAVIDFEVNQKESAKRKTAKLKVGDDIYRLSNGMNQYKGYVISDISPYGEGSVTFTNGTVITGHKAFGDMSEMDKRRIQIRETVASHFEKEEQLFNKGIKTLSLFFIDEVANYRQYDKDGNVTLGEFGRIFEEEYNRKFDEVLVETLEDTPYRRYLQKMASDVREVHTGYFSIDKKGRSVDSKVKKDEESANDENAIRAYDLIMKKKEQLLSFDEPVRFIFSHSALREGWDNPNIFQICTLKHSSSEINKRQEVGRGMRLCVNQDGCRQDLETCGDTVHDVNLLTVIASESYEKFVSDLQKGIRDELIERPSKVTVDIFKNRRVIVENKEYKITDVQANDIYLYMAGHGYVDIETGKVSDKFREDSANDTLEPVQSTLNDIEPAVKILIRSIFDEKVLDDMISNANETRVPENKLNRNFSKKEFQELWKRINHKYAYKVSFDSKELIEKSIIHIKNNLRVTEVQYVIAQGIQHRDLQRYQVENEDVFESKRSKNITLKEAHSSNIKYDLLHEIASRTALTRRTVAQILDGLGSTMTKFAANPEEFIRKVSKLINEQKANMIVEGVEYNTTDETFESDIFVADVNLKRLDKAFKAGKHITDYVVTDGMAEKSVERRFAEALDVADEVAVYAKLPRGFYIPTPVGNYSPDWAIAFKEGCVQHIYFVAETKGTNSSLEIKPVEAAKIRCAEKLFKKLSNGQVHYSQVKDYSTLMDIVKGKV